MNLIESYALACGQKIDKITIQESFYPVDVEKYITVHAFSKPAKSYDYFEDVIISLLPALESKGIKIVQIGGKDERALPGCIHLQGKTSVKQTAYIIKNSLLHLGVDSFPCHLAGAYNIPLVALYSSNYLECARPYFGHPSKQILFEPDRTNRKPSFSIEEHPKTINEIKPENIVKAVLTLLDFKNIQLAFETIWIGPSYINKCVESVPNQVLNLQGMGLDNIIFRMDYLFNEDNLYNQLLRSKVSIITDKPVNLNLLAQFKDRIPQLAYVVSENDDPTFAQKASKLGIPFFLLSFLPKEQIQKKKIQYMDIGVIHNKKQEKPEQIKNIELTSLIFRSNKFLLSEGKIFLSKAHWKNQSSIDNFNNNLGPIIDHEDFWNDSEFYYFLKRLA